MFKINNLNKITNITTLAILLAGIWITQPKTTKANEEQSQPTSVTLTGTIRDLKGYRKTNGEIDPQGHPDFERQSNTDTNPQGQKFQYGLDLDITTDNLVEGKPEYASGSYSTTTKSNFDQWNRSLPLLDLH